MILPKRLRLVRKIEWSSPDGAFAVIRGPFPQGFVRSLTSDTVAGAAGRDVNGPSGLMARSATTHTRAYALVLRSDLTETHNEWGECAP